MDSVFDSFRRTMSANILGMCVQYIVKVHYADVSTFLECVFDGWRRLKVVFVKLFCRDISQMFSFAKTAGFDLMILNFDKHSSGDEHNVVSPSSGL